MNNANNNPRNLPDELSTGNRPPRYAEPPMGHSAPGSPVTRDYDTSDGVHSSLSAGAPREQHPAFGPTSEDIDTYDSQGQAKLLQNLARLRERRAAALASARPDDQNTFVTADQHLGNPAHEQPGLRLDERVDSGDAIRPYPNPVPHTGGGPSAAPQQHGQTTRVAPHGLYAALSPMPGGTGADGPAGTYLHGASSYAYLDEVPGAYPHSATSRPPVGVYIGEQAASHHSAHEDRTQEDELDADFMRSPEMQQAYVQWHARRGLAGPCLHEQQGHYGADVRAHTNGRSTQANSAATRNPGLTTTWNSECAFMASTAHARNPSRHTRFNGPGFAQDEMPEVFGGSDSAPSPAQRAAYTIATPTTIQTRAYIRPAPFELGDDLYDYLMDLATTVQAHGLDLDSWGAQAVMASVDTFYRGVLAPYLHVKLAPLWREVCAIVGDMIKPLVTPEIARRQLAEGRMDIYRPFLVFTQMFEKMHMLANIPKGSPEARTYFLCSLDRVVQRLLLNQFPTWIREGNLDAG
ncbi:hypothetical protein H4R20_002919 [Coemansia guatemalensis]|uniref:Uncharacterized protein n=1 Tax=Coemansia guatemalensis TaxID=2761395 RepID=A0A9W8LRV8_9FUNG|nr:hypothetical protein H4R20_002919 [Coemansia guatemalensis]